jgi:hypothetical protein
LPGANSIFNGITGAITIRVPAASEADYNNWLSGNSAKLAGPSSITIAAY